MSIYNEVKFGKEAQDEIYEGAKIVGRAVASSLGPNGKTALIEGFGGNSYINQWCFYCKSGGKTQKSLSEYWW